MADPVPSHLLQLSEPTGSVQYLVSGWLLVLVLNAGPAAPLWAHGAHSQGFRLGGSRGAQAPPGLVRAAGVSDEAVRGSAVADGDGERWTIFLLLFSGSNKKRLFKDFHGSPTSLCVVTHCKESATHLSHSSPWGPAASGVWWARVGRFPWS